MKLIRRFYREYVLRHWGKLLLAFLLTVTANQAPYGFSLLGKWLVDDVLQVARKGNVAVVQPEQSTPPVSTEDKFEGLWIFLAISLSLRFGTAGFGGISGYLTSSAGQRVLFRLRSQVQTKLSNLPLSYFDKYSTGQLMVRVMDDANSAQNNTVNLPVNVATQFVTLIVGLVLLWEISPTMTLMALGVLPFYATGAMLFMRPLRKNTEAMRNANAELQSLIEEKLTHVATIKYYAQEAAESTRFFKRLQQNLRIGFQQNALNTGLSVTLMIISGLGATGILLYGFLQLQDGTMKLGEVLAVYQMTALLFGPITALTNTNVQLQTTRIILERIYEVLDMENDLSDDGEGMVVDTLRGDITFENVSLRYIEGGPVALQDVNFHLPAGQTLAVLGPSGCGKTAVVNVLSRFYDPTEGRVLIDGLDIRTLNLQDLREQIGMASQEARIFSGTVAQNIAFGDPDIERSAIEHAAQVAGIRDAILELPKGYDTPIGKGGESLSQDVVQRISIARTLLGDPAIFVFDDSVSALSEEAEELLFENIEKAFEKQTIIIVTNRVRTAENAHQILVMSEGHVVEQGSHDELVAQKGVYWRMYVHQTHRPDEIAPEPRLHEPDEMMVEHV